MHNHVSRLQACFITSQECQHSAAEPFNDSPEPAQLTAHSQGGQQ